MTGTIVLKKLLLILSIITVIYVSGCIGGSTDNTLGNGVVIQGWQPDFSSVESSEPIKFFLKVQNQGETLAENVVATIMGIDTREWGLSSNKYEFGDMRAPDTATNTPGEVKTYYYTGLTAPKLPKGTSFTYEPIVRVTYDYKTISQKPITVVDVNELRRLIQQGETIPSKDTVFTAGPLSVEIRTGNYVKTQKADDPFPVYIVITNDLWESGGSVVKRDGHSTPPQGYDYPIKMKVNLPSSGWGSGQGGIRVTGGDKCSGEQWIDLWQGKTAEITCELQVDPAPENARIDRLITVELDYSFQLDSKTAVTVTGN
jgi:hypothetical protein